MKFIKIKDSETGKESSIVLTDKLYDSILDFFEISLKLLKGDLENGEDKD